MKKAHPTLILFLFFLTLLGPFAFAVVLVQKGYAHQFRLKNHGDLITPVRNLAPVKEELAKTLAGKWWLVMVGPEQCYQGCQTTLYNMRQIRTALGKDAPRLERLFIHHPHCPISICEQQFMEQYPEMRTIKLSLAEFERLFMNINGELYIIDPKGNLMMRYEPNSPPKDVLSDLKRLLKVSKIG